ncbi:uncharacterized protein BKA78DRAFT_14977 [Phyllosticta capitalensis]|uniref:Uncharacterized protein n=1 Tax=Phyllosticta capitalensis TaxID=121624 RepID=A0ABR1Z3P1_9PEZI
MCALPSSSLLVLLPRSKGPSPCRRTCPWPCFRRRSEEMGRKGAEDKGCIVNMKREAAIARLQEPPGRSEPPTCLRKDNEILKAQWRRKKRRRTSERGEGEMKTTQRSQGRGGIKQEASTTALTLAREGEEEGEKSSPESTQQQTHFLSSRKAPCVIPTQTKRSDP